MRYKFKCDVTTKDCWILYMQRIYHSMVGIVSVILALSFLALTTVFWQQSSTLLRILLILACLLVPVIQPLGVWIRSRKLAKQIPSDLELWFGDKGIYVKLQSQTDNICWKEVRHIIKERNMITIVLNDGRGYMLTNRILGKDKESFYQYISSHISK